MLLTQEAFSQATSGILRIIMEQFYVCLPGKTKAAGLTGYLPHSLGILNKNKLASLMIHKMYPVPTYEFVCSWDLIYLLYYKNIFKLRI